MDEHEQELHDTLVTLERLFNLNGLMREYPFVDSAHENADGTATPYGVLAMMQPFLAHAENALRDHPDKSLIELLDDVLPAAELAFELFRDGKNASFKLQNGDNGHWSSCVIYCRVIK
ncbi:hypothetical protein UFOVP380_44 [uncultured Caudovirales phage]|uniref:Uncharacterized protein n=1 Tax=uncultured Caudovirales phage TaxID=2100421 RepID=A0A6J7X053_9CAUD|nr:hypothetical protein UFOVP380_44 [uncultured Caudovirales phage]